MLAAHLVRSDWTMCDRGMLRCCVTRHWVPQDERLRHLASSLFVNVIVSLVTPSGGVAQDWATTNRATMYLFFYIYMFYFVAGGRSR